MEENKFAQEINTQNSFEDEINKRPYKNLKDWFKSLLLGILMGLAIIIPGISGGTIAILFKLYDKMLYAISNILKKFKWAVLFLLPLVLGIIAGFAAGFFAIQKLIDIAMLECVCLFAGLMFGSMPTLKDEIKGSKPTPKNIVLLILGICFPLALAITSIFLGNSTSASSEFTEFPYYLFLLMIPIGFFMGISQTVPGISATAFLMTIGMYYKFINTVHLHYWQQYPQIFGIYAILFVFFLLGIFLTSKLVTYLLNKYHVPTYYTLIGFLIGSLICMFYNSEINALYSKFLSDSSANFPLHISIAIPLFIIGVVSSYMLVVYQRKQNLKK